MNRLSRNTDPETSHLAEEVLKRSGRQAERLKMVFALVKKNPGRTSSELGYLMAQAHPDLPALTCYDSPHKRLPDLEKLKLVRKGDTKTCPVTKRTCLTWWPR